MTWTADRLRSFELGVKEAMQRGEVRGPCHLSGGNELQLLEIFEDITREDVVFSSYRSHYHALLHGVPQDYVMDQILAGHSMALHYANPRFYSSAIVGGCLPIAVGVAAALKRRSPDRTLRNVWCFVGDMAASAGTFHDCEKYARRQDLPITFVIEDNGMSTYTPTQDAWGSPPNGGVSKRRYYCYDSTEPHIGATDGATI